MKKVMGLVSVIIMVGIVAFLVVNRTEATTFGELIHKELTSSEIISEVYISSVGDESTTITNREEIEKIIKNASAMDLTKVGDAPNVQYSLRLRTEENYEITVAVGEERIDVWDNKNGNDSALGGLYEIEGTNSLLEVIQESNYEWETR
ncbi:hypothetical protein [Halobacillus sp. K22]|uniref:hypothetical protein n=1 Tax=Halobacillus sp. K22 TaxID=3457431 RepID=UPI003FCDC65E